jgi:putative hydrolase of HD superfamily
MSAAAFSSLPAAVSLYFEFVQLKQLRRQGWLRVGVDVAECESVADHSFAMALLGWFLCESESLDLDVSKVIRMALLHDFGEIDVGDLTPSDGVDAKDKLERERQAIARIFALLANGEIYRQLWEEYEAGVSPEARFVRQLDKLEMALQAVVYEGETGLDLSEFLDSASRRFSEPRFQEILQQIEGVRSGFSSRFR